MEQVGVDLKMELVYSQVGVPRGRGKIERFFGTVNQLLLERLPGYIEPKKRGKRGERKGELTLAELEQCFGDWLLDEYHMRVHGELKRAPQEVWEEGGFMPRMPQGLEELDLLLLEVVGTRKVQQDGISFQGVRYQSPTLSAYVKEEVDLRYDPRDMAEVRVWSAPLPPDHRQSQRPTP
jgi:putative transposase